MKKLKWISLLFVMALGFSVFAACSDGGETFTVTFYGRDGETVIKTVEVEEGEKVDEWTPTEDGWTFVKWSATPNLKRPFPFDDPITQDMSVFSSWKSAVFEADTRERATGEKCREMQERSMYLKKRIKKVSMNIR